MEVIKIVSQLIRGGAKRVELNSALSVGGLTPSLIALKRVKEETDLKVMCMVRPRAGGFCYDKRDIQLMMEEAKLLLDNGADGIVFGFLNEDGSIAKEPTSGNGQIDQIVSKRSSVS